MMEQREEEVAIVIHSTCLVLPATPTECERLSLANLDTMWNAADYSRSLFFFRTERNEYLSIVQNLKRSLALALVEFYPFAGRLRRGAGGRLEVDCNDAGVEFLEATVDFPFAELEEERFQIKPFFRRLAPIDEDAKSRGLAQLPLLSLQVTRFPGGEIVIGVAHNHVIADGKAFWYFWTSWMECARGLPISSLPVHLRAELLPSNCKSAPEPPSLKLRSFRSTKLAQRVFHFSRDLIEKLKTMSAEDGNGACTAFDVLCAHVWKHVAIAREVEEPTQLHGLIFFMDIRSRVDPPLPPGYFGNAVIGDIVFATARELEEESLGCTGGRIHEKIAWYSSEAAMRAHIRRMELGGMKGGEERRGAEEEESEEEGRKMKQEVVPMVLTFSPKIPVYESDFGFGKPRCVRGGWILYDGEAALYPGGAIEEGSVDVCLGLPPRVMAKLQSSKPFLLSF